MDQDSVNPDIGDEYDVLEAPMEWTVGDFEDLLRPDGATPMLFPGHEGWEFAV
jgi:hypothetical protein